jgi:hypothetical protein
MLETRSTGFAAAIGNKLPKSSSQWREAYHVDNNMRSFAELAYFVPAKHPFVYHNYFIWLAARPIPRVFWPGKPEGPGFDLPKAMGERGVSLSVTLVGELYMAGGLFLVVAGGFVYGRLASMVSTLLQLKTTAGSLLSYGLATLAMMAGMRSGIELVLMSYPLLAWGILIWLMGAKHRGDSMYLRKTGS